MAVVLPQRVSVTSSIAPTRDRGHSLPSDLLRRARLQDEQPIQTVPGCYLYRSVRVFPYLVGGR